jgi:hypothetical protein
VAVGVELDASVRFVRINLGVGYWFVFRAQSTTNSDSTPHSAEGGENHIPWLGSMDPEGSEGNSPESRSKGKSNGEPFLIG